jgi:hypothetical protein
MFEFLMFAGALGLVACVAVGSYQYGRLVERLTQPTLWERMQNNDTFSMN